MALNIQVYPRMMAMSHAVIHHPFPRFLAVSITLHLLLFAGLTRPLLDAPDPLAGDSVLEIRMLDHTLSSARAPSPKPEARFPVADKTATRAVTPGERVASTTAPVTAAGIGHRADESLAETREGLRVRLLGVLKNRLSPYLSYPYVARTRGWEGMVLLGLRLEPDGQFDGIRIERSSGHAVLDDSALNSLKRLGNLVEARVWLEGRSLDMQIPIIFRLVDD